MSTTAQPATPTPASAPPLAAIALGDLAHELATTRRVLERVPTAHFDWRPHAKSFTLGHLAAHVAQIPVWGTITLTTPELDFAAPMERGPLPTDTASLLATWDANVARLHEALAAADDAALRASWTARSGAHVVFAQPRVGVLRGFVLSHLVHHRAQLGVYLRLLDLPVPSMYGPTADEAGM